jgi:hypothetical protein
MKFIHTFWSKPLLNNKFNKIETLLPVLLTQYAYSAECVHRLGEKIVLFADEKGAALLSHVPYDDVILVPELENESEHFAAQLKFYALRHSDLDDIIIDGDLFLLRKEVLEIIKNSTADVLCSFIEPPQFTAKNWALTDRYSRMIKQMDAVKYSAPYELPRSVHELAWANTSLLRVSDPELREEYIRQYFHHKELLQNINFEFWPDIIIEQRFLTLLVHAHKKTLMPIVSGFMIDPDYNNYAIKIGFAHLGEGKVLAHPKFSKDLEVANPELYARTIKQINKYLKKLCYVPENKTLSQCGQF